MDRFLSTRGMQDVLPDHMTLVGCCQAGCMFHASFDANMHAVEHMI